MKNKLVTSTLLTNSLLTLLVIVSVNILFKLNTNTTIAAPSATQVYINKHCSKLKEHIQKKPNLSHRELKNYTIPGQSISGNLSICTYLLRANPPAFIE